MALPNDPRSLHVQVLERLHKGFSGGIFDCWDETGFYPERLDQPRDLQLLWAATYCHSDVINGGFLQFFTGQEVLRTAR